MVEQGQRLDYPIGDTVDGQAVQVTKLPVYTVVGMAPPAALSATTATPVQFALSPGAKPNHAIISVETNSIRYTINGQEPTSAVGIPVAAGGYIDWTDPAVDYSDMIQKFKVIGVSGTATLNMQPRIWVANNE